MHEENTRVQPTQNNQQRQTKNDYPPASAPQQQRQDTGKKKKKKKKSGNGRRTVEVIISLILVVAVILLGYHFFGTRTTISQNAEISEYTADSSTLTEATEETTEVTVYESIAVDNDEMYNGSLIVVNNEYEYASTSEEDITSIYTYKTENDVTCFSVSGAETSLRLEALEAFTDLCEDFYVYSGHDDIIVMTGYRTLEEQQELYDEDLESTGLDYSDSVAEPGHSEHETGYAMDVSIYTDGTIIDYDGTGDYTWVNENCDHYGYILRYTEEKADITGFEAEEWHYRYVGEPHATYIMDNDLCLEEYISLLQNYSADNPLEIINWDGEIYQTYYVEADTTADVTYVLVPSDLSYTISGNNIDGFIVTVDTGEIETYVEPETEETTDSSEESDSTESTDSTDDSTDDSVSDETVSE